MSYFTEDSKSAYDSKVLAQLIAFAPVVFQVSRLLKKLGILAAIRSSGTDGLSLDELESRVEVPRYGIKVLVEAGLGIGLLIQKGSQFFLTKTGHFILTDSMTGVNLDFMQDVCYKGLFHLEEAILEEKPSGLKAFGEWETIYEALSHLPANVQKSWFDFDHYYSDLAFPAALPQVFKQRPKTLLDVGGNTGKWAFKCVAYDPQISVTILDLPGQVAMAKKNIQKQGLENRIKTHGQNVLDPDAPFPKGFDAIWMSQFLDCFSLSEITLILRKSVAVMSEESCLYILEPYWDRQQNSGAAFCVQATSLYFTCMANGDSQMYHSDEMKKCVQEVGLKVVEELNPIGLYHTLFRCQKA